MSQASDHTSSRRAFLKHTGRIAAASALAGTMIPRVHAAEDNTLQLALVGCGGRGTGAVRDAMSAGAGPLRLVAMADVFEDRITSRHRSLMGQPFSAQIDVPEDRRFVGFDAYRKAMDCLRPGDVVILATPPAFRWVHFGYAVAKGLNVFMEKPITVDGPTTRKMLELGRQSVEKNLKVGVGLMCRHCKARQELFDRIRDGQIGDILTLRAYRMHPPAGSMFATRKPEGISEVLYQVREFLAFLWASGGAFSDFLIHNIDECCWMKDAWPIQAQATGGRHYRGESIDQNFDNYAVEYTFDDGSRLFLYGRYMPDADQEFASYAHGTKGSAVISTSSHRPAKCRIYRAQRFRDDALAWAFPQPEPNPYELEWADLIGAIRQDKPYNEVQRGAEASLIASMGRMAAHTGRIITRDEILNCDHEFAPEVDKLAPDGPAPLVPDANGAYPVPMPGIQTKREY